MTGPAGRPVTPASAAAPSTSREASLERCANPFGHSLGDLRRDARGHPGTEGGAHDRGEVFTGAEPFLPAGMAVAENGVGSTAGGWFPGVHDVQRGVAESRFRGSPPQCRYRPCGPLNPDHDRLAARSHSRRPPAHPRPANISHRPRSVRKGRRSLQCPRLPPVQSCRPSGPRPSYHPAGPMVPVAAPPVERCLTMDGLPYSVLVFCCLQGPGTQLGGTNLPEPHGNSDSNYPWRVPSGHRRPGLLRPLITLMF